MRTVSLISLLLCSCVFELPAVGPPPDLAGGAPGEMGPSPDLAVGATDGPPADIAIGTPDVAMPDLAMLDLAMPDLLVVPVPLLALDVRSPNVFKALEQP